MTRRQALVFKCSVMKRLMILSLFAAALPVWACTKDFDNSTVKEFDLERYLGEWYEIARYDHSFERGMDNTMAQYIMQDNGKVVVLNTGWKDGKFKLAEGKAKYPDPKGDPGALRVSFFLFFYSDYNVMMVDENYQISLVAQRPQGRAGGPDPCKGIRLEGAGQSRFAVHSPITRSGSILHGWSRFYIWCW